MRLLLASFGLVAFCTTAVSANAPPCGDVDNTTLLTCMTDSACDAEAKYPKAFKRYKFVDERAKVSLCQMKDGRERFFDDLVAKTGEGYEHCSRRETEVATVGLIYVLWNQKSLAIEERQFQHRNGAINLGDKPRSLERMCK